MLLTKLIIKSSILLLFSTFKYKLSSNLLLKFYLVLFNSLKEWEISEIDHLWDENICLSSILAISISLIM